MIFVSKLLSLALLLFAVEMFFLSRKKRTLKIWSFENLKEDLTKGLPLPDFIIEILFSDRLFPILCVLQIILATAGLLSPHLWMFCGLFFIQLIICIRFRGTFNGGSDMMSFVAITGVIIGYAYSEKLGLIYIAIHLLYSYFKAGFTKLLSSDWRNGQALPIFLQRSLFSDIKNWGAWLQNKKGVSLLLCWFVILFELFLPSVFFIPFLLMPFALIAILFHFTIYWSFGLNRFFWIWLCTWPVLFFL